MVPVSGRVQLHMRRLWTGSKGAGMGFLTVARDAREPLEFDFVPAENAGGSPVFYLKAAL